MHFEHTVILKIIIGPYVHSVKRRTKTDTLIQVKPSVFRDFIKYLLPKFSIRLTTSTPKS